MIRVQKEDFDVGDEINRLSLGKSGIGGIVSFVGLVRDFKGEDRKTGEAVSAMTLEHYPAMTAREIERVEAEARQRWRLEDCLVIHRYGRLVAGDRIVLVVTAAAHRGDAFAACEFLIDWLKTKAPFWKQEETPSGTDWVGARAADDDRAARWAKD